jgi:acetyl-CoA acetyltransferase
MRDVYIIGSYSTQFKKWPKKSYKDLTRDSYLSVLQDAQFENGDEIQFAWFGNCFMGFWEQMSIRGQVCFIPLVREGLFPQRIPVINVEGACATASMAFHGACKDIMSGQSEVSLAMGVEKIFNPEAEKQAIFKMFDVGIDNFDREETVQAYKDAAVKCGREFAPGPDRTMFMDTYAIQACYHMWKNGTTQKQIAIGASKNHYFGSLNPKAQYKFEVSVEQVLEDREVSYPLTRSMCAPIGDGAAAAIVCSGEYLKNLPSAVQNRAIKVKATVLTGGKYRDPDEPGLGATGLSMIYELATQLRGEAGSRQVKNAEFALQENGGGVIGLEEAACSVVILQKDQ